MLQSKDPSETKEELVSSSAMPPCYRFSLNSLSYYRTGGPCLGVFQPSSIEELAETLEWLSAQDKPYFVLGAGSNSLISDLEYPGYVISMVRLKKMKVIGSDVVVGGGVNNSRLCGFAYSHDLKGLAWMNGLPGQVGGSVRMNARCYGSEVSKVVSEVSVVSPKGKIKRYLNKEQDLFFGYKDTVFMNSGEIIAETRFSLEPCSSPEEKRQLYETMEGNRSDRQEKGQFMYPSCGCVFKNDYSAEVSVASGVLLERAGAKGMNVGKAVVSSQHANFIYNQGAPSADILELSFQMREKVYEVFGVWLCYEMELLGYWPISVQRKIEEHRELDRSEKKVQALESARRFFQERTKEKKEKARESSL